MLKAILSRKDLTQEQEFFGCVEDLLNDENVLRLKNFKHHYGATRFQHCLNVSYYNFLLCRFFGLDARAAARGGMLHDLFFYNRKEHVKIKRSHASEHAHVAYENAEKLFSISELEGDMIVNHMWPLTISLPKHPETFMITVADKFCCIAEIVSCAGVIKHKLFRKAQPGT